MTEHITYCRSCGARCGVVVEVVDERVVAVRGDQQHPLTRGYTCVKGRRLGDLHADPRRFRSSRLRRPDGSFEEVDAGRAVAEAAQRLRRVLDDHGPDAIGMYWGTHGVTPSLTKPFAEAWWSQLGSRKWFSTMTIDQAPKWVAPGRIGQWLGGPQRFEDSDVWVFAGTNPPVSMLGGVVTGFPQQDALNRVREARRRGTRLVVIDPRRTELASQADLHLQLVPGTDALLLAGMLARILATGRIDHSFCDAHVADVAHLREVLASLDLERVAGVTGVETAAIVEAADVFAAGSRGMVSTGTGANMGPWSNLVEHLAWCLNIVCGRFARSGEVAFPPATLGPAVERRAEVVGPDRTWERGFRSRVTGDWGQLFGELPTPKLPDEILEPGPDRIRALVVVGGNPASSIPDQDKTLRALDRLESLVVIEPFPTETAAYADVILAPTLALERAEHTGGMERHTVFPFAQYTPAVLAPPPGLLEDWQYLLGVAHGMGMDLEVFGRRLGRGEPPVDTETLLAWQAEGGRVTLEDVRRHPHGLDCSDLPPTRVREADPVAVPQQLRLLAPDVERELYGALADESLRTDGAWPFRLVVRRARETFNSTGRGVPGLVRTLHNPLAMHPADAKALGVAEGDRVLVVSEHGEIPARATCDATLRPGAVSMTHAHGWLPGPVDDHDAYGSNVNRLLSADHAIQPINAMPHMTAVPVRIELRTRPT